MQSALPDTCLPDACLPDACLPTACLPTAWPPVAATLLAHGLSVSFHGRAVLLVPDFRVNPGEVWHVTGPNGAGKTTLLRALSGELAHGGRVSMCGAAPASIQARRAALLVPTEADLVPDLSVRESLQFMAAAWNREPALLLALAHAFGLDSFLDAWPEELSRGTRQKVALSAALGLGLPLTLLDEPFATLDARSRAVLLHAVRERARAGGAVIVTTHGNELSGLSVRTLTLDAAPT